MRKVLGKRFFNRDTQTVACELLGKFLVRGTKKSIVAHKITEVEVYDGHRDKASHASRGITSRNAPMFGHPGYWYVYLTYGMHWMLNIVTREHGYPGAVLIRAVEHISGPARLTKALRIDSKCNACPASEKIGLWIEDRGVQIQPKAIHKTPRVGIDSSGPYWSKRLLRYVLKSKLTK